MVELVSSSYAQQMGKQLGFSVQNCNCLHPHVQLEEKTLPSYLDTTAFCKHLATDLLHLLLVYKHWLQDRSNGQ